MARKKINKDPGELLKEVMNEVLRIDLAHVDTDSASIASGMKHLNISSYQLNPLKLTQKIQILLEVSKLSSLPKVCI